MWPFDTLAPAIAGGPAGAEEANWPWGQADRGSRDWGGVAGWAAAENGTSQREASMGGWRKGDLVDFHSRTFKP